MFGMKAPSITSIRSVTAITEWGRAPRHTRLMNKTLFAPVALPFPTHYGYTGVAVAVLAYIALAVIVHMFSNTREIF